MTFAAVISDFDGVLADSTAAIRRVWARWGERHGIDGAAIQEANHGRPSRAVVAEHVAPHLVDAESAWVLEAEVADTGGVVAYPGAAEVLALPVVAIATSCEAPLARARLAAAGLAPPDVLVTADQVVHGKPAPDPYLLAAERLGVAPGRLPRAGGRAERRRRRARRRHDRLGGHDHARARRADRRAPGRGEPARAARRPRCGSARGVALPRVVDVALALLVHGRRSARLDVVGSVVDGSAVHLHARPPMGSCRRPEHLPDV